MSPNLRILGSQFQTFKSGFRISTSNIPCEPIFSQNRQLSCFVLNLEKMPKYVGYFGLNIAEGVAESWVETEMSCIYKLNDSIGDLSKTIFWYYSNDIEKNPSNMLCSRCSTNDSSSCLHITVAVMLKPFGILQRVTKCQKVHISSHDVLQKLHNIDFVWHRSRDFLKEEVEKQEFPAFPMKTYGNNQKLFSSNLIIYSPY